MQKNDYMLQLNQPTTLQHPELYTRLAHFIEDLPLVKNLQNDEGIDHIIHTVEFFKQSCKDLIIIGTGGSIMTAKTFEAMAGNDPFIHLLFNIDPTTVLNLVQNIDLATAGLLVISKSGKTAEILALVEFFVSRNKHIKILTITENRESPLYALSKNTLAHPNDIGGRFSAFTATGIAPCVLFGFDPYKFRFGAECALDDFHTKQTACIGATFMIQKPNHVYMTYCDKMTGLMEWVRQLVAESLGKHEQGITPIVSYGTIDQHSQLQLYLDGTPDKAFTFLSCQAKNVEQASLLDNLFTLQKNATIQALKHKDRQCREIHFESLDEFHVGYFMFYTMLEVLMLSLMLKINPFDQPAVEISKKLAQTAL